MDALQNAFAPIPTLAIGSRGSDIHRRHLSSVHRMPAKARQPLIFYQSYTFRVGIQTGPVERLRRAIVALEIASSGSTTGY